MIFTVSTRFYSTYIKVQNSALYNKGEKSRFISADGSLLVKNPLFDWAYPFLFYFEFSIFSILIFDFF